MSIYQQNADQLLKVLGQICDRRSKFMQPVNDLCILNISREKNNKPILVNNRTKNDKIFLNTKAHRITSQRLRH